MNTDKMIVSFGEALWDVLPTGAKLGGAPLNFIYRINCFEEQELLISSLGMDELGIRAKDVIEKLGIECSYIQANKIYPTGTVRIEFDNNNQPSYEILVDVAYDHIELTSELLKIVGQADCIYFGTLTQRLPKSRDTLYTLRIKRAPERIKHMFGVSAVHDKKFKFLLEALAPAA